MNSEYLYTSLIYSITETIDLISPIVANHHKLVAYISYSIGEHIGMTEYELIELEIAASLHDIGGLTLVERLAPIEFDYMDYNRHAEKGYFLLKDFKPLSKVASIIRYHHKTWNYKSISDEIIPIASSILYLADRISILIKHDEENILNLRDTIIEKILKSESNKFNPDLLNAFIEVSQKDSFWLQMKYLETPNFVKNQDCEYFHDVDEGNFDEFILLISRIIDFKSRFTAAHSYTLAACAEAIASYLNYDLEHIKLIKYAGYLHDLGKLAIPAEILEKPSGLTNEEFALMRSHTFHTNRVLFKINGFDEIRRWGSYHHEKLNGKGYPFRLKDVDIPMESRIISVADIFTAIREERPYRGQMTKEETIMVLKGKVEAYEIDNSIVDILIQNFDAIDEVRSNAHNQAIIEYNKFTEGLGL